MFIKTGKRRHQHQTNNGGFNIFASNTDYASKCLKRSCFQKCFYETNKQNNIVKYFVTHDVYKWETSVYLYLLHRNITPLASITNKQQICYQTSDTYTLYEYMSSCDNIHFLLNEAFSFVKSFTSFGFVHGNANVFNILVNRKSKGQELHFFVIDFSNSYIINDNPEYTRSLDLKSIKDTDNIVYWDIFSLYMSLKSLPTFKKSTQKLMYLERLITTYIQPNRLIELMRHYNYLQNESKRQLVRLELN